MASFSSLWKPKGQKLIENATLEILKWYILCDFQTMCNVSKASEEVKNWETFSFWRVSIWLFFQPVLRIYISALESVGWYHLRIMASSTFWNYYELSIIFWRNLQQAFKDGPPQLVWIGWSWQIHLNLEFSLYVLLKRCWQPSWLEVLCLAFPNAPAFWQ